MNTKYMTNGALLVGPVVPTGEMTLGVMPQNQALFLGLSKRFRVRRHSDGWFVDGKGHKSQIWEYGKAKLGLTVTSPKFIRKCRWAGDWLTASAVGDKEANFFCGWSDANLVKLTALTGLQRRKKLAPKPS